MKPAECRARARHGGSRSHTHVCFSHGAPLHAAAQHKPTVNQVTDDMLIKISDFGLSRTKKGTTVINSIHIAGSPGWMAPEVRGGIDIGNSGGDREEWYGYREQRYGYREQRYGYRE